MKAGGRTARLVAALGVVLATGCLASDGRRAVSPQAAGTVPVRAPAKVAPEPAVPTFDPGRASFVLDDPRLSAARSAWLLSDWAEAARRLETALSKASAEEALRWHYQLGRLYALAGDPPNAARAFDAAAETDWPLAPYARFGAAQALIRAGRHDEGLARADAVAADLPIGGAARLLAAEAFEAGGDHERIAEAYGGYLEKSRHPPRWIDAALRAADAILATHPRGERAEQAAKLARRVLVEAPTSSAESRALAIDRRALALASGSASMHPLAAHGKAGVMLPRDWAQALSPADAVARASALFDARGYKDADQALDAFFALTRSKAEDAEVLCRAELLHGNVLGKLKEHAKAADAYGRAIADCEAYPDALVESLYWGAKSSALAGQTDEALDRFGRVERDFRTHRYADDARLRGAECVLEQGDEQRYEAMLRAMPDDYPTGDMIGEGLFRLALRRMIRGEWAEAVPALTRGRGLGAVESPPGRFAYFVARALGALGDVEAEKRGYEDVIRSFPLSYYMLHAYGRLAEVDPARATASVDAAIRAEPKGEFAVRDSEAFHRGAFERGLELLRQGENDLARRELNAALVDGGSDVGWAVAVLYARVGLVRDSYVLARTRLSDWLSHYPAGRWREAWQIAFPRPYAGLVEREARESGIPFSLAYAVMREESAFDPEAVSPSHAFGLMQLIVPTAQHVAKALGVTVNATTLTEPEVNVKLGCRFLGELRARFAANPHLAVPAYNAGPGAPQKWLQNRVSEDFDLWVEQIPFDETRRYLKRVLTSFAAYSFLYEKQGVIADLALPKRVEQ